MRTGPLAPASLAILTWRARKRRLKRAQDREADREIVGKTGVVGEKLVEQRVHRLRADRQLFGRTEERRAFLRYQVAVGPSQFVERAIDVGSVDRVVVGVRPLLVLFGRHLRARVERETRGKQSQRECSYS
jgi:hypothetical protein